MTAEQWGPEWEKDWEPVYSEPAHATTVEAYDAAMAGTDLTFVFETLDWILNGDPRAALGVDQW